MKKLKKLTISKETLRRLDNLTAVRGGYTTGLAGDTFSEQYTRCPTEYATCGNSCVQGIGGCADTGWDPGHTDACG